MNHIDYLSSMALFEKFYEQKKDACEVVALFLGCYLKQANVSHFNLTQIAMDVNNFYNFKLPLVIVELGLSKLKFVSRLDDKKEFVVSKETFQKDETYQVPEDDIYGEIVFKKLVAFVNEKQQKKLSEKEESDLLNSFCDFLLDGHCCLDYYEQISKFILDNDDSAMQKQLESIADGMIVYRGITIDVDVSEKKPFQNPLVLYLDTEILFHLAGFNGVFYQQQFNEFFNLIQEVNKKKKIIELRYFKSVNQEINNFFTSAADVVEKRSIVNETTAMTFIIKGCERSRHVFMKKRSFERLLEEKRVILDNNEYMDDEDGEKYGLDAGTDSQLSCINILRKGLSKKNYLDIGFILISGKNQFINYSPDSATDECRHLAISLGHITKIIWFALNKGFGVSNRIISFDVIKRAKMVISSVVAKGLKQRFEEAKEQYEKKAISLDDLAKIVLDFRNIPSLPENIEKENYESVLRISCEDAFNRVRNENSLREAENISLKEKLENKDNDLNKERERNKEIFTQLTNNMDSSINMMETANRKANDKIKWWMRVVKVFFTFICVASYIVLAVVIKINDWNILEKYTYILGFIPVIFIFILTSIWGKSINPQKWLERIEKNMTSYFYKEYGVDLDLLQKLKTKRNLLNEE